MQIKEFEKRFSGHIPRLSGAKAAFAVLVPLVYEKGEPSLLFEVRADTLNRQPGEVCFPGGRMEGGETPLQCALRETEEELSLPAASIHPAPRCCGLLAPCRCCFRPLHTAENCIWTAVLPTLSRSPMR